MKFETLKFRQLQHWYPSWKYQYRNYFFGGKWEHLNIDMIDPDDVYLIKHPAGARGHEVFFEGDDTDEPDFYLFQIGGKRK